jgi:valine--pyruvate aminotransferase
MSFSQFGEKFNRHSGITQLMDDLNDGLRTPGALMLGGGNPAQIPAMNDYFENAIKQLIEQGDFVDALTNYDGPQGSDRFVKNLAKLLQQEFNWPITEKKHHFDQWQPERVLLSV